MSSQRTVAKNATVLMASQILTWALTLLLTIFLPRHLGAEAVGKLHLASSLWAVALIFVTFGCDLLITKEVARDPKKLSGLFSNAILLQVPLFIVATTLLLFYAKSVGTNAETFQIIGILGISQLFWQIGGLARAALEGLERMEFISIAEISSKAFNTVVCLLLILVNANVLMIAVVAIGMAFIYMAMQLVPLLRIRPISFSPDFKKMGWMLKAGSPYLIVYALLVVYVQMDVVILQLLTKNETVVGWYSAADRLFGTMLFVPTVFITAVFPLLSRMHTTESKKLPELIQRSFNLLLLLSIPLGLGLTITAQPIVLLLFGEEFRNSGPILAVMGIVLMLMYQNILLGRFLVSVDRQHVWTWVMVGAVLLTIGLDMIFVPYFDQHYGNGAIGGAFSYVITEGGMMCVGLWILREFFSWQTVLFTLRALLAGGLMLAVVWIVRDQPLIIPIGLGAVIYTGELLLFGLIPQEDWEIMRSLLPKRQPKQKIVSKARRYKLKQTQES